jgi:epoxyqueuosine reductase
MLTPQERLWLGEWVFGCDVCQDVCPFNVISIAKRDKPDCAEFGPDFGSGQSLDLARTLKIREEQEFVHWFAGTPLMRTKREGLLRNSAVVAANTRAMEALGALEAAVRDDPSPIVRAHALWAYVTLASYEGSRAVASAQELIALAQDDGNTEVRAEAGALTQVV